MSNSKTFRTFALAVACALSMTAHAVADTPKAVNVVAGNLADALEALAKQCGVDVIYPSSQLKGLTTEGVSGVLETRAAFQELIRGTRLVMKEEGGSVLITLPTVEPVKITARVPEASVIRLAQADQADSSPSSIEGQKTDSPGNNSSESPAGDSAGTLEEVVVTAQRRDESLQRVPISVQAFTAEQLENKGIKALNELPQLIAGVGILPSGLASQTFLRGVGGGDLRAGGGVLLSVDGVYQPFPSGIPQFATISGIEVDKGPQGTLFGRNATGGVIQISTRKPTHEPTLETELGYANYDTVSGNLYASTGLSERIASDLSAYYSNRSDGWGINVATGNDVFKDKEYGVRSKTEFELSDRTTAELIGDYVYSKYAFGAGVGPRFDSFLFNTATRVQDPVNGQRTFTVPSGFDVNNTFDPESEVKQFGPSLKIQSAIAEGLTLTSTSAYRWQRATQIIDADGNPNNLSQGFGDQDREALSQELQLASDRSGGKLTWVTGLFYLHDTYDGVNTAVGITPRTSATSGIPAITGRPVASFPANYDRTESVSTLKTDAIAGYAQGTLELVAGTHLTLGTRYTEDRRKISGFVRYGAESDAESALIVVPPAPQDGQSMTYKKFIYRVALDHQLTDSALAYVSYATSFNAGSYNVVPLGTTVNGVYSGAYNDTVNPPLRPENIAAYELGLKTSFFDNRVRANIAGFWYDYTNQQVRLNTGTFSILTNAGKSRMKGIDFELTARPMPNLTLSLNGEYLDAKYREYLAAPQYSIGPDGSLLTAASPTNDAGGNRLPFSPKVSLNADATYVIPTAIGDFSLTPSVSRRTTIYNDPFNAFALPPLTLLNLSARWVSTDTKTDVRLFMNNVTDREYSASVLIGPGRTNVATGGGLGVVSNPGAPRTYGVTVGRKF